MGSKSQNLLRDVQLVPKERTPVRNLNFSTLPEKRALYMYSAPNGDPVYIGVADNLKSRLDSERRAAERGLHGWNECVDRSDHPCPYLDLRLQCVCFDEKHFDRAAINTIEKALIGLLAPTGNVRHREREAA